MVGFLEKAMFQGRAPMQAREAFVLRKQMHVKEGYGAEEGYFWAALILDIEKGR